MRGIRIAAAAVLLTTIGCAGARRGEEAEPALVSDGPPILVRIAPFTNLSEWRGIQRELDKYLRNRFQARKNVVLVEEGADFEIGGTIYQAGIFRPSLPNQGGPAVWFRVVIEGTDLREVRPLFEPAATEERRPFGPGIDATIESRTDEALGRIANRAVVLFSLAYEARR